MAGENVSEFGMGPAGDAPAQPADATATFGRVEVGGDSGNGLSSSDADTVAGLPSGSGLLVVERGPNAGARFLLDADVTTAGRRPDSDIFLDDVTVSRKHAEFVRQGRRFLIRDVGSLNGTYLRRDLVDEAPLANGDEVQIGKFRMTFYASPLDADAS